MFLSKQVLGSAGLTPMGRNYLPELPQRWLVGDPLGPP
jgi:hypothetical protein